MIDSFLEPILRCPEHLSQPLRKSEQQFHCTVCGQVYPVSNGMINMMIAGNDEHQGRFFRQEEKQWDEHAAHYDERRENSPEYRNGLYAGLAKINPVIQKGQIVLDVGCGTGLGTCQMHRTENRTVAMDISSESLRYLKAKCETLGILSGMAFVQGGLPGIPFADKSFDHVICANALQHLPNADTREATVRELSRVLKPGGTAVVSVHNYSPAKKKAGWKKEGTSGSFSGQVQYIYRLELEEFRDLLERHLTVSAITGAGFALPYKWKLSPVSFWLERQILQQWTSWADKGMMSIAVCQKK